MHLDTLFFPPECTNNFINISQCACVARPCRSLYNASDLTSSFLVCLGSAWLRASQGSYTVLPSTNSPFLRLHRSLFYLRLACSDIYMYETISSQWAYGKCIWKTQMRKVGSKHCNFIVLWWLCLVVVVAVFALELCLKLTQSDLFVWVVFGSVIHPESFLLFHFH